MDRKLKQDSECISEFDCIYIGETEWTILNATVNDTKAAGMKVNQQADNIKVEEPLDITSIT